MHFFSLKQAVMSTLIVLMPLPVFAARNLTLYLDGAMVSQQENARRGIVEFLLPASISPGTLRIYPAKNVSITKVTTTRREPSKIVAKELSELVDREERLQDRLKALTVREEIFKSAAKSQSAKAPRRTRTNPEPLSTIRKGTDYAMTQLESVYQAKRKVEADLAKINQRRTMLQKEESADGFVARVWVTPHTGKVIASWVQPDRFWKPSYQLRINGTGEAKFSVYADNLSLSKEETVILKLFRIQSGGNSGFPYTENTSVLEAVPVTISGSYGGDNTTPLSLTITNASSVDLPAGETSCFKDGVYMGKGQFRGADVGKISEIVCNDR